MTLHLPLSPEVEAKLRARAAAMGTDPAHFILNVLEEKLAEPNGTNSLTTDARVAAWNRFVEGTGNWTKNLPPNRRMDDSRDSIYDGRGE